MEIEYDFLRESDCGFYGNLAVFLCIVAFRCLTQGANKRISFAIFGKYDSTGFVVKNESRFFVGQCRAKVFWLIL